MCAGNLSDGIAEGAKDFNSQRLAVPLIAQVFNMALDDADEDEDAAENDEIHASQALFDKNPESSKDVNVPTPFEDMPDETLFDGNPESSKDFNIPAPVEDMPDTTLLMGIQKA